MIKSTSLAFLVLLLCGPAVAQTPPPIRVEAAWARSTPPMARTGAAYMTLVNTGTEPDRLLSASTPIAGEAELHRTVDDHGVMRMQPAGPIELKPGDPVVLGPAAMHMMLIGLKAPLADGQSFPLELVFEKAGKIEVTVQVRRTAPESAQPSGMGGMQMGH